MLLLCLGSEYFHEAFHRMGHTVIAPPHQDGYPLDAMFNSLRDRPDLIVYTDHLGVHAWPEGLSSIYGIPKVYYGVDTPINFWWQRDFASLFDYSFTDQKPFANYLAEDGLDADWLPVGVDTKSYQPDPLEKSSELYDFGFVGVVDEKCRPKRSRLVNMISSRWSLKTAGSHQEGWLGPAESGSIYRQSRLALNENLFPGITTRMLEAMAAGTVLFTEKAGGDLGELFVAGEDFAWFDPEEIMSAAEYWLGDDKLRQKTAKRALEKVTATHDIYNRAETLLARVSHLNPGRAKVDSEAWDQEGKVLFLTALRWPKENGQARIKRAESLFLKAREAKTLSPGGLFMLGHIARLRGQSDKAINYLTEAFETGEPRGALGLGIMYLASQKPAEARQWLARFTGTEDFPELALDTLHFEAVRLIADRLLALGHDVSPGFSRLPHDPALWNAFEFYQSAFTAKPSDLDTARSMAGLLLTHGAAAEAMDVAQKGLEYHPTDEILGGIFAESGRASYLTIN